MYHNNQEEIDEETIIIDADLDETGFQAGSEKILKAVSSMMDQVSAFGSKVRERE